jgi:hypothetical protein
MICLFAHVPPASPDELLAFIKSYHRGLHKITVKLWQGRKRYSQLNSVLVGATHDELPSASIDQIARAVMAVAQDYYESTDQPCKFMAQAHVFLKATGDAARKAFHFELGHGHDGAEAFSEHIGAPEHMDDVMLGHIRECHREILDQARIISEIGREAIQNAGQVFAAKQEALDAQAQAQMVILDSRREEAKERAQQQKWEKGFKMLEKAINTGIAQAVVASATGRPVAGALPAAAAGGVAVQAPSPPTTPTPSWAAAAGRAVAPSAPAPALAPATSSPDTEDNEMEDDSYAFKGRKLYASITAEQWPELFEALTKTQVRLIKGLKDAASDEDVLTAAGKLRKSIKDTQMAKLGAVLTVEQIATVIELGSAAGDDD